MRQQQVVSFAFAALCAVAITTPAAVRADQAPQHIRGTISAVSDTTLTVKTASGPVAIALGPKFGIAGATAGSVDDIGPGKYLGVASTTENGVSRALEVTVFDESLRGTAEGDSPWDSPSGAASHSAMTNGTVDLGSGSAMTNGTAGLPGSGSSMTNGTAGATGGHGKKTIALAYKGGTRTVVVPANVPVVHVAPGTKALLKEGASVFVLATNATPPSALFVVVGENGTKVPI